MSLFQRQNSPRPTAFQNFRWDVADWFREHALTIFVLAVWAAFLFAFFVSAAKAEPIQDWTPDDQYVEAWVEEEVVVDEYETCFSPYAPGFVPEFWIENMSVTMFWYDTWEEFAADTGLTDPDDRALSYCETKPDKNFAYCDVYMVKPEHVDDEATLSGGHEFFHGLFGAYHE